MSDEPNQSLQPRLSHPGWVLAVLVLVYLVNYIDRTILYLLQEPIKHEFHLADWQMGLLGGTAFGVFYATMGIPIARLAERRKRTSIIVAATVAWSIMTAICGAAGSFVQLLLARVGVAVGEAGASPPAHSIITDYFAPGRRATALSIYVMAVPLGQMMGALLGGSLAQVAGWRWAFVIVGLPGILVALLVRFTLREPPRGHSEPNGTVTSQDIAPSLRAVLARAASRKAYLHVLAGSTIVGFAGYALVAFSAAYFLRKFDLKISSVGMIYGLVFGLASAVGTLSGGSLADRWGKRDIRIYGWLPAVALAMAFPMFVIGYSRHDWLTSMLCLIVPGVLSTIHLGPTYSIMHNSFEPRMRATVTALTFLAHSLLGLSLGPLALGLMSDLLSAASFGDGDFAAVCGGRTVELACRAASANGLQWAMMIISVMYAWGAIHYVFAGLALKREVGSVASTG